MRLITIHNNLTGFILALVLIMLGSAWGRNYERKYMGAVVLALIGLLAVYGAMVVDATSLGRMCAGLFALVANVINCIAMREKQKDMFFLAMFIVALIAINAMIGFALLP
ncbi:MAG: hypothetical protein QMC85_02690 [Methanocellales archaeon]|nr:hypothetical protein [Methanocellales archaeon]MDI6902553.1 hypothetical protein [Methanocellales archaeon]